MFEGINSATEKAIQGFRSDTLIASYQKMIFESEEKLLFCNEGSAEYQLHTKRIQELKRKIDEM